MAYNKPTANQISLGSTTNLDQCINPSGIWIGDPTNLQGPTGTGVQGVQGSYGFSGGDGAQGYQGLQGTSGTNGSQGTAGTGTQGVQGTTGTGTQGTQGTTGSGGLSGSGTSSTLAYWSGTSTLAAGPSYSGGVITATDFSISSDSRLKDIIGLIPNPVDTVNQINGVKYKWNDFAQKTFGRNTNIEVGVIAQDIQNVLIEAVSEDADGYLTVKYDRLIPVLIEAIKELNRKIDQLERRVWYLE